MVTFEDVKKLKSHDTVTLINELYDFKVSAKYSILWNIHLNVARLAVLVLMLCNIVRFWYPDIISSQQSLWITLSCFPFMFLALIKQKDCRKIIFDKGYYTLTKNKVEIDRK